jgi:hAT family C-terminal dimerisation region
MFGAWDLCGGEPEWFEGFPCLMQLWQIILVLPASLAVCERGFSKLNRIKNDDRSRLSLDTLDVLMFLSLSAPHALNEVDWNAIYDVWKLMKARKPLPFGK